MTPTPKKTYRHKGLQSVYRRAFYFRLEGGKASANPYSNDGRTFATAYHNAWHAGWWEADQHATGAEGQG